MTWFIRKDVIGRGASGASIPSVGKDLCWVGRHVSSPRRQVPAAAAARVILSSPVAAH